MSKTFALSAVAFAVALSAAGVTSSADAQFVQEHIIAVESATPASAKDFLQGNKGPPVQLAGGLRLAKPGPKQPVVVICPVLAVLVRRGMRLMSGPVFSTRPVYLRSF